MPRMLAWFVTGSLLCGGALLSGCPEETTSDVSDRPVPAKARDYLFPTSPSATYVYERTVKIWQPSSVEPDVSTRSFQIKTVLLTGDQADLVQSDLPEPLLSFTSTNSFKLAGDGTVTMSLVLPGARSVDVASFPDAALTKAGATVIPASGSLSAQRISRVGSEKVTVPAGHFDTVKVKQESESGTSAPTYVWLAKGMTFQGVKMTHVSTYSSITEDGIATTSSETVLTRYTP